MRRNALLAAVEPEHWGAVQSASVVQTARVSTLLQQPGDRIAHLYFPLSAVVTLTAETAEGEAVDVSTLGPEGALGLIETLGSQHSHREAAVLIAGQVVRMRAAAFHQLYRASQGLREAARRFVEMAFVETQQAIACGLLHNVDRRLASALLVLSDRAQSSALPVTQEALSRMLGVQRTTITPAIARLKANGVITSWRGGIEVTDHQALEATACSCAVVRRRRL